MLLPLLAGTLIAAGPHLYRNKITHDGKRPLRGHTLPVVAGMVGQARERIRRHRQLRRRARWKFALVVTCSGKNINSATPAALPLEMAT